MNLVSLNDKLERSPLYIFTQRHKKVINVFQGLIIIGLLIGINMYVVKDYKIKQQIADHCGYETSRYSCVCEKSYVDKWIEMQNNGSKINIFLQENVDT